jgi:hypothetical protein
VIEWAGNTELDLRSCGFAYPVFGLMDGVQWMLFLYAHTERRRAELRELKRSSSAAVAAS